RGDATGGARRGVVREERDDGPGRPLAGHPAAEALRPRPRPARVRARGVGFDCAAVPGERFSVSARLAGAPSSRRSRLKRLLIIPGAALALWMAAVLLITDRSLPVRDPRRFKK